MINYAYIHIPFCKTKCRYCAFISYVNLNLIDEYVNKLLYEIDFYYDKKPLKTLYIGGGTPSLLTINQIEKIINKFNFIKTPEITIELNPDGITTEYLKGLYNLHVNRLSIGAQTFNDKILKEIGRNHTKGDILKTVDSAKEAGFKNISLDLIYGLPNQTIKDFIYDLEIIKKIDIEHLSTYGLKIEDKTYYRKYPPKNLPDDDKQRKMYEIIPEILEDFYHYEISNFAKNKNFISKHNMNYWNLEPYYGFGVSASGFEGNVRYKNTDNIKKYLTEPASNLREEIINTEKKDLEEEMIFLGFRKIEGIDVELINKKFNTDFNHKYKKILDKYINSRHIEKTGKGYKLTKEGILLSNYILCDFLC